MLTTHTLPIGWEQRLEASKRVFYIDHNSRSTTLVDPRTESTPPAVAAEPESLSEYLMLCSGVLTEQAVGPSDFRAALNRALRHRLSCLTSETSGSSRERRLQMQQYITLATLERLGGSGMAPRMTLARAFELHASNSPSAPPTPPDSHLVNSLFKHGSVNDLMSLYTSGGPARAPARAPARTPRSSMAASTPTSSHRTQPNPLAHAHAPYALRPTSSI